jgi:hypothetical protein
MIHPSTELRFISDEKGYGLVATERIPKGTITWVRDRLDREFTPAELETVAELVRDTLMTYCFRNRAGNFVLCWDSARFMNHSFRPNCLATAYNLELAVRDIRPGEELTNDYGHFNIIEPFRAGNETPRRKHVYPDDLLSYHSVWDRRLASAFQRTVQVDQPLRGLLPPGLWETCQKIARGEEKMQSVLTLYYDPAREQNKSGSA